MEKHGKRLMMMMMIHRLVVYSRRHFSCNVHDHIHPTVSLQ